MEGYEEKNVGIVFNLINEVIMDQITFTKEQETAFKTNMKEGIQADYAMFVMFAVQFAVAHPEFKEQFGTFGVEYLDKIFTY
jgi:hypothetical protein